jgi:hypothetical protein
MRYVVDFERATADFDLTRDPPLLLCRDDRAEPVMLERPELSGYDMQVRYIVERVARGETETSPNLADAVAVAKLLDAERASLLTGEPA